MWYFRNMQRNLQANCTFLAWSSSSRKWGAKKPCPKSPPSWKPTGQTPKSGRASSKPPTSTLGTEFLSNLRKIWDPLTEVCMKPRVRFLKNPTNQRRSSRKSGVFFSTQICSLIGVRKSLQERIWYYLWTLGIVKIVLSKCVWKLIPRVIGL